MLQLTIKRILFVAAIIFASNGVFAQDKGSQVAVKQDKGLQLTVKLAQLSATKTSEKSDELYFSITQYSSQTVPAINRVPMFPLHWRTKDLATLKDITLWEGTLKNDESVLLVLTLLEQDVPPWDADDHIGSAQVRLANKNGKLTSEWGMPHFKDQPKVVQKDAKVPKFEMFGADSQYVTVFKIETGK